MINNFMRFVDYLNENNFKIGNQKLDRIVKSFTFVHISQEINIGTDEKIFSNFKESNVAIVNQFSENTNTLLFIICFKQTIIIIEQTKIHLLDTLISFNPNLNFYFLNNSDKNFVQSDKLKIKQQNKTINYQIYSFNKNFQFRQIMRAPMNQIWKVIQHCIAAYMIIESYEKLSKNRLDKFTNFYQNVNTQTTKETWTEDDYIELGNIGASTLSFIFWAYHIEKEELYAIKKPNTLDEDIPKLFEREQKNYSNLNYPLLPTYYGTVKISSIDYLIIEYIQGVTLADFF